MKIPPPGVPNSGLPLPSASTSTTEASARAGAARMSRRAQNLTPEQEEQQRLMKRTRDAQQDATREIALTEAHVREAQEDANAQLDRIRETASEEIQAERDRSYEAVRIQTQEGYQQLAALKRRQAEEMARVQREGDKALSEVKHHYGDELNRTEKEGHQKLYGTLDRNSALLQHEQAQSKAEVETERKSQQSRLAIMKDANDAKLADLRSQQEKSIAEARETLDLARDQARSSFENSYAEMAKKQQDTLEALNSRSSHEINRIRDDSSEKLVAYEKRQRDPFYKLKTFDAELEDQDDAFVLRARIPVHERQNITINVQPESVTITGSRRNLEKLETEPGHTQSTASFQTVSESFPLSFPVDSRAISRQFDGDEMIVTLPKKVAYRAERKMYRAPVERSRAERPEFPGNLPVVHHETDSAREPASSESSGRHHLGREGTPPGPRRPGGRTLG